MKTKTLNITTLALLPAALFTLTSCSSPSKSPPPVGSAVKIYTKGVPGGVVVQTVKVTATVTAIDPAKRKATLMASDGKKFTVKAGPEAVNFDQIRVGDQVIATLTQKVVVSLEDKAGSSGEGAAAVVARAPKGGQPGGLAAETIQVAGKVIAIDLEKRKATLQFEDGSTETFSVRPDVDLSRHKVGERVIFRVTEMIAIWVEKPQ
jgi:translation elongation factor P/translation initiation factor 5A